MTTAEMTTARNALYTQYMAWINAGCPQSYTINNRTITKCSADFWLKQIGQLDNAIAAAGRGTFAGVQFRKAE